MPDEISGFPTIKLFPAGSKSSPVEYSGDRSIEDIAKFIGDNGKFKIDAYAASSGSKAEDVVMDGAESLAKVAPAATEVAKDAAAKASDKAADVTDAAKSAGSSAGTVVEEKTDGIKEKVASKVADAADAVKTAVLDGSDEVGDEHDEL